VKNKLDSVELLIPRGARSEGAQVFDHLPWNHWRVQFPCFVATEKKVAVVALQIAALTNLKDDVQVLDSHGVSR
jgi:hypothetical protein